LDADATGGHTTEAGNHYATQAGRPLSPGGAST
jgi:hypothetical protein